MEKNILKPSLLPHGLHMHCICHQVLLNFAFKICPISAHISTPLPKHSRQRCYLSWWSFAWIMSAVSNLIHILPHPLAVGDLHNHKTQINIPQILLSISSVPWAKATILTSNCTILLAFFSTNLMRQSSQFLFPSNKKWSRNTFILVSLVAIVFLLLWLL